ncbi:hypothetical protein RRG08_044757 [Elysia crispata]|uniref:Uncharacterized protein n=1 Tax=Elysia crispata TaxID=231223 RepID=A0AAE1DGE3_9GAST|nr:hypothetical protein RRG08_044757 [Elysia crispata]
MLGEYRCLLSTIPPDWMSTGMSCLLSRISSQLPEAAYTENLAPRGGGATGGSETYPALLGTYFGTQHARLWRSL